MRDLLQDSILTIT